MFGKGTQWRRGALGLTGAALAALPALALAPGDLSGLARLEHGRWSVRDLETQAPRHSICLGDPVVLVRLEHRGAACSTDSVTGEGSAVTVQYSCPGHGFGHTYVRMETPRTARVETQGILDGRPFAYRAEARHVGAC